MLSELLNTLFARRELPAAALRGIIEEMIAGRCDEAEAAAFLIALRMKGETAGEIATAAQVLREHMVRWDPGRADVLDTCGTGGDGSGTFNISTATALVVAGCGVPVVKHGNRSVSSKSGSADVLAALGVKIDGDAAHAQRSLAEAGFAFCFAPLFHPALKHVAALRRRLGVPTIFNCLGPLANPAGAVRQLLGIGRLDLLDRMAGALAQLGTERAILVCSDDGLDEVSLSAPTQVREVVGGQVRQLTWTPADFGLEPCALSELSAADAAASAQMVGRALAGEASALGRITVANAAAGLLAAGRVPALTEGVACAREAIQSGRARLVLEKLRGLQ
ncbi:MAG: anthranilate phosphoribosyltransferase [Gemmataceae bacterium]|nr:anthranilate phosphoribosyltransferase [Gemmataceae bacterium]